MYLSVRINLLFFLNELHSFYSKANVCLFWSWSFSLSMLSFCDFGNASFGIYIYIYRSVNVHIVTFTVTHMHDTILMVDYSSHMLLTHIDHRIRKDLHPYIHKWYYMLGILWFSQWRCGLSSHGRQYLFMSQHVLIVRRLMSGKGVFILTLANIYTYLSRFLYI